MRGNRVGGGVELVEELAGVGQRVVMAVLVDLVAPSSLRLNLHSSKSADKATSGRFGSRLNPVCSNGRNAPAPT